MWQLGPTQHRHQQHDDDDDDDDGDVEFSVDGYDEDEEDWLYDEDDLPQSQQLHSDNNDDDDQVTTDPLHFLLTTTMKQPLHETQQQSYNITNNEMISLLPQTTATTNDAATKRPSAAIEAPIIDVMDRIEDEMEAVTYEELVPLDLQMALEDRVFGWTHLTSSILGHLVFTLGAYFVVYLSFDWVGKRYRIVGDQNQNNSGDDERSPSFNTMTLVNIWHAMQVVLSLSAAVASYRMVRRRRMVWLRAAYGSKRYQTKEMEQRRRSMLQETDRTTVLGRTLSSFLERRVRKRLQRAEKQFAKKHARDQQERARQQQLELQQQEEADMDRHAVRFVDNDNDDGNTSSDSAGNNTTATTASTVSGTNTAADLDCGQYAGRPIDIDGQHQQQHQFDDATNIIATHRGMPMASHHHSIVANSAHDSALTDDSDSTSDDNSSEEGKTTASDSNTNDPLQPQRRLRRRQRRPSFHTEPTKRMKSIGHDQILFRTIENMPYVHGGFFGAAPFLLANPHWISILRHLMPDVYVEISRRITKVQAPRLIHWAENNPVVAAYGAANELEYHQHIPNMEWDVFLDPLLVKRVQVVLDEQAKFKATTTLPIDQQRNILAYYDHELKRRSRNLVDKMLIAHGSLNHLILEQTGILKSYNYSRVKRSRRTLGGGIYARQWMAVFAEALKLGMLLGDDLDVTMSSASSSSRSTSSSEATAATATTTLGASKDGSRSHPNKSTTNATTTRRRQATTSLLKLAESKCPTMSIQQSVRMVQSIAKASGSQPIGLVLDVKSRHVSKQIWSIVIDTLRSWNVRVEGIASFTPQDIRGVSTICAAPVQEIVFFHSAGDLQRACHDGKIQRGDKVFFNAGCLLSESSTVGDVTGALSAANHVQRRSWIKHLCHFDPRAVKDSYFIQPLGEKPCPTAAAETTTPLYSTVEMYRRKYDLSIGLYCQEFAIDEAAANMLAEYVNDNPTYALGFSWGGVNGITIQGICPGRFTATDGYWNQRYVGAAWDYSLFPQDDNDRGEGDHPGSVDVKKQQLRHQE